MYFRSIDEKNLRGKQEYEQFILCYPAEMRAAKSFGKMPNSTLLKAKRNAALTEENGVGHPAEYSLLSAFWDLVFTSP